MNPNDLLRLEPEIKEIQMYEWFEMPLALEELLQKGNGIKYFNPYTGNYENITSSNYGNCLIIDTIHKVLHLFSNYAIVIINVKNKLSIIPYIEMCDFVLVDDYIMKNHYGYQDYKIGRDVYKNILKELGYE